MMSLFFSILLFVVLIVLFFFFGFIRILTSLFFGKKRAGESTGWGDRSRSSGGGRSSWFKPKDTKKKIIDDSEGEYVDFEEVGK